MKTIIGAIALVLAVPAAAQTAAPAGNPHAGHHQAAPAANPHAGHAQDKAAHDCMAHCQEMMKKHGMKDCAEMMRTHQAKHGDGKGGDAHKDHKPSN